MGNYRFKLADMMPNSWFYKLKEKGGRGSGKKKGQAPRTAARDSIVTERSTPPPLLSPTKPFSLASRPSYYVTSKDREDDHPNPPTHTKVMDTLFPLDTPTKSKKNARKKPLLTSTKLIPTHISPLPDSEFHVSKSLLNSESMLNVISDRELHPITTKPNSQKGNNDRNLTSKQGHFLRQSNTRKSPPGLHRAKIRMNSPRLAKKRVQASTIGKVAGEEGLKESIAVVKSSANPQKDFRESMVEMIVENNLLASKDLEELLACYLSLNSHEYHDMIVEVFQQIWIALTQITF